MTVVDQDRDERPPSVAASIEIIDHRCRRRAPSVPVTTATTTTNRRLSYASATGLLLVTPPTIAAFVEGNDIDAIVRNADEEVATDIADERALKQLSTAVNTSMGGFTPGGSGNSTTQMDMNMYATRKTIAQGIMDFGLMCANASQLKYVLLNSSQHRYFQVTITLIVLSILFQVIVGIFFIALGRLNINFIADRRKADMMNNASVILIFFITVVNVLITAFGPSESLAHLYGNQHALGGAKVSFTNFYPSGGDNSVHNP